MINTITQSKVIEGQVDIITEVKEKLIRNDGKLNSPAIHSKKNANLIARVIEATKYLDQSSFSQRWWHLNNGTNPPLCYCGQETKWNNHSKFYPKYCSHLCATTSKEARERAKQTHKGRKHTKEQKLKQSKRMMGHLHSEETKQKQSEQKQGNKNPQFGKPSWNKGLLGPANPNFGKKRPGVGLKGKNNPQFGKSPSSQAGRGIYGKFNNLHFRSSLELMYLIYWWKQNIIVKTAETNEFRVEYLTEDGTKKTYSPDFYIEEENKLIEIKPEKLHTNKTVLKKLKALKNVHSNKNCKLVGFKNIGKFIREIIKSDIIKDYFQQGRLKMSSAQYERLRKNYADIIRATT